MTEGGDVGGRLSCPTCGAELPRPEAGLAEVADLSCPGCGRQVRARRRRSGSNSGESLATSPAPAEPLAAVPMAGGIDLTARALALRTLEGAYRAGLTGGTLTMLALGGFVPVVGGWLRDDVEGWGDVVATLGGVRVRTSVTGPDADLGPAITRTDAPRLFAEVVAVARMLGAKPPRQVRLTYLPCCLAMAWGRDQALALGLPLLDVLSLGELRAVLAHEMAHLARGDATSSASSTRFVEALGQALDGPLRSSRSPLRMWARLCRRLGDDLLRPVARGQEARADRAAATVAGGDVAASALVKVALVQPLFREVLEHYDSTDPELPNLYAFFRDFWGQLPAELRTAMRHQLLTDRQAPSDGPHPALLDRLALVQSYPARPSLTDDDEPAVGMLGDLPAFEQMLHNRLFAVPTVEPSTFHRAGS